MSFSKQSHQIHDKGGGDLSTIAGVGVELPVRVNTKFGSLLCIDCGQFTSGPESTWRHLQQKHLNLKLKWKKQAFIKLAETALHPYPFGTCSFTEDAFRGHLTYSDRPTPIQGITIRDGYVCSLCLHNDGSPRFASIMASTMWKHGNEAHNTVNHANMKIVPVPPFADKTKVQQPWIGLALSTKTVLAVNPSNVARENSFSPISQNPQNLDDAFAFVDSDDANRDISSLFPSDMDSATRLLALFQIVPLEVIAEFHWLGNASDSGNPALDVFRNEIGQHVRSLSYQMNDCIQSLSTLDVKLLLMECDVVSSTSDHKRYLKTLQERSTLNRYSTDLMFVIQYVCLASDMGTFLRPGQPFPDELKLTDHERANFDVPIASLLNHWQHEGSLTPDLVWDLICSVFLRVLNPFKQGSNDATIRLGIIRCSNKDTGIVSSHEKLHKYLASLEHMCRLIVAYSAKKQMDSMTFPPETDENTRNRERRAFVQTHIKTNLNNYCVFGNISSFKGQLINYSRNYGGPRVHASAISSDLFTIDEIQFSFTGFRRCLRSTIDRANEEVDFLMKSFPAKFPPNLIDDPRNTTVNASFKDYNGLLTTYQDFVQHLSQSNPEWDFIRQKMNQPLSFSERRTCEQFREHCCTIESCIATVSCIGTGGGGRATTLFSILLRNTEYGSRNLFVIDGHFVLLLRYDKTSHITESDQITLRVFPPSMQAVIYRYTVYLKPLLALVKARLETTTEDTIQKSSIKNTTLDYLYSAHTRGRWTSADFRECVKTAVDLHFPSPIGNYTRIRQALQYMAKCFLATHQDKPDFWESIGFDDQQGHSRETGENIYGVTEQDISSLFSENVRKKQFRASFWWFLHMLDEGPMSLSPKSRNVHITTISDLSCAE